MSIEEVIELLKQMIELDPFVRTEYREKLHQALKIAIRSLEAWEKVKEDVEDLKYIPVCNSGMIAQNLAYDYVLGIINKHLKEVEE